MTLNINRRQFIQTSAFGMGSVLLPKLAFAEGSTTKLPIPPLLESKRGQPIFLTTQTIQWAFIDNKRTFAWGINGQYIGPTVRVKNGDNTKITYNNRLNEEIAMNVMGLHIPSYLMGSAHYLIQPGQTWSPVLPIRQYASTCNYQAVTPNKMAPQIYNGLVGFWLVEDENSKTLPLPNEYGVDDIPLILQDKRFDSLGQPVYDETNDTGHLGDRLIVNGVENPFTEVPKKLIRLRLLNASNARRYTLKLSNGEPILVIASEQGYLTAPAKIPSLSLAPGERREILVDMSNTESLTLVAGEEAGFLRKLRGMFESSDEIITPNVITLRAVGDKPFIKEEPPTNLVVAVTRGDPIKTREIKLESDPPSINQSALDTKRVDTYAKLGTWERWVLQADTPQSFFIQGAVFFITEINGAPPFPEDRGLSDTVWVDGKVELLVFFTHVSNPQMPFFYGSRTLELADRGALAQLVVEA